MDINQRLISAVRYGELETAKQLLDSYGLSYSEAWSEGYVLLRYATENRHKDITKLLLIKGAKVNSKNCMSYPADTPLHYAVRSCDKEIIEMLIDRGAKINIKNAYGNTPIHDSLQCGEMEIIELLLDRGADINDISGDNITPLYIAVESGCLQTVEYFLNRGARVDPEINLTAKKQYTPLQLAVKMGSEEIVQVLLNNNADVNARSMMGITPLHVASEGGHISIAENLLNHGACVNSICTSTERQGYTPLHLAVEEGRKNIVELLLSKGADIEASSKYFITPLHIATKTENEKIVKLLLDRGANVNAQDIDGITVLHVAVKIGYSTITENILKYYHDYNTDLVRSCHNFMVCTDTKTLIYREMAQYLLQYGLGVNGRDTDDRSLLHAAAEKGYVNMVKDLLTYNSDVNMLYNSTYEKEESCVREKIITLLLNQGQLDVNVKDAIGKTPIFYAIKNCDLSISQLLLTNGAEIKDPDLLNTAVEKGCLEMVEILLQNNADVNACDEYGQTALHFTALTTLDKYFTVVFKENPESRVKREIAKLLLSKGANVNAANVSGLTILHISVQKGYAHLVETLLQFNVDVNVRAESDVGKVTPLHIAAQEGNLIITKMLLEFGADVDSKWDDGRTALHIACEMRHSEVMRALLDYRALRLGSGEDT